MDRGAFVTEPEATLRHVMAGMSVANVSLLHQGETLNLYDPKHNVVGAVYFKSLAAQLIEDVLAVGLGKNATGEGPCNSL
jgi:hypothetical protein